MVVCVCCWCYCGVLLYVYFLWGLGAISRRGVVVGDGFYGRVDDVCYVYVCFVREYGV